MTSKASVQLWTLVALLCSCGAGGKRQKAKKAEVDNPKTPVLLLLVRLKCKLYQLASQATICCHVDMTTFLMLDMSSIRHVVIPKNWFDLWLSPKRGWVVKPKANHQGKFHFFNFYDKCWQVGSPGQSVNMSCNSCITQCMYQAIIRHMAHKLKLVPCQEMFSGWSKHECTQRSRHKFTSTTLHCQS